MEGKDIGILVFSIVVFVWLILLALKHKDSESIDSTTTKSVGEKRIRLFMKKHPKLGKLWTFLSESLLNKEVRLNYSPYCIPNRFKESYKKAKFDSNFYQALADDMKNYLNLQKILNVSVYKDRGKYPQFDITGLARPEGWHQYNIELWIHEKSRFYHNAAHLAHEITHAFLHAYSIRKTDEDENESLTDIAAIFLGFEKVYKKGRQPLVFTESSFFGGSKTIHTIKYGYLNDQELSGAIGIALYQRANLIKSMQTATVPKINQLVLKQFIKEQTNLLTKIENLQSIYEHNISVLIQANTTDIKCKIDDPHEQALFAANMRELSSRTFGQKLNTMKEILGNATYESGIDSEIRQQIDQISRVLMRWNGILGKYL